MAEQFYTLITLTGQAKIANANVLGNKVNFVKLKVGDGGGSYYNPTESATDIRNKVWEGSINSIYVDESNPNWIVIESIIPSDVGGFFVREAGVYDEENNLIAIGKYPETYKPVIAEGSAKDLVIRMILEVSNSESVTLKIDPTVVLATKKDVFILESRIAKNETDIQNLKLEVAKKVDKTDYVRAGGYAVTSGTNIAYTITTDPAPTSYGPGMQVIILPHIDCGANPTLNWNGLGAGSILNQDGTAINAGDIKANKPLGLVRVGSSFFIYSAKKTSVFDRAFVKNPWQYIGAAPPTQRTDLCAVVWNGKAYTFCGNGGAYANEIYDIASNTWSYGANVPYGKFRASSVVCNGKVYIMGGNGVNPATASKDLQIYDIASNTWSQGATIPSSDTYGIYLTCAEVWNGKIYLFEGEVGAGLFFGNMYIYDIATNKWTVGATMPTKRAGAVSAVCNGKIYIIGGWNASYSYMNTVEVYDIASNTWGTCANMILARSFAQGAIWNGKIHVFGGRTPNLNNDDRYEYYDIASNTWVQGVVKPTGIQNGSAVAWNGKVFCLNGTGWNVNTEILVTDWNLL